MPGRRAFLLALGALPLALDAATDDAFVIATSTPGGGFSRYGDVLAEVINRRAGSPWVRARMTRGTTENLQLLARGEVDAALIQGTAASEVFTRPGADGLCVLFAMYPSPGMLAVPASSPARRLEDLLGQPVVFGVRTSGLVTLARQVFDGIGRDIDRDFAAIYVTQAAESPRIVLDGRAAGLWGAGEGWPGFETLAASPGGARFLGPSLEQIQRIVAKYPLLKPMDVPASAYSGITAPLPTVGSVNLILARADLDAARAKRFVEAMHAAEADLAAALPQAAFSTLANTRGSVATEAQLHRAARASVGA